MFKSLDKTVQVAPQITLDQLDAAKAAGITTIISHRPDDEEPGQLNFATLKAEAEARGLTAHHIPVVPGRLTPSHVEAFRQATADCDGQVLAFCRSGMRASMLWALSKKGEMSAQDIMSCCQNAGFDVSPLAAHLAD
jgi:sulfide:quinone oxidoreductase